ncbi:MAG: helix-hairpin-helix domain-containing protein, partial [Candidatus Cloacimonetes bacterium]|nr:helix-hairpin-helix domain-containing protein [Candidatus Cloacimonadota bacterium]
MFSKKIKLILFILFTVFFLEAEDIAEIFSIEGETYFTNEIVENLEGFRKSPLNINKASREDLEKLPWLSEDDINNIIKLRKTKKISDWDDLNKIGINKITISELKEYIIFK